MAASRVCELSQRTDTDRPMNGRKEASMTLDYVDMESSVTAHIDDLLERLGFAIRSLANDNAHLRIELQREHHDAEGGDQILTIDQTTDER